MCIEWKRKADVKNRFETIKKQNQEENVRSYKIRPNGKLYKLFFTHLLCTLTHAVQPANQIISFSFRFEHVAGWWLMSPNLDATKE